jgi:hypothetical protein
VSAIAQKDMLASLVDHGDLVGIDGDDAIYLKI